LKFIWQKRWGIKFYIGTEKNNSSQTFFKIKIGGVQDIVSNVHLKKINLKIFGIKFVLSKLNILIYNINKTEILTSQSDEICYYYALYLFIISSDKKEIKYYI